MRRNAVYFCLLYRQIIGILGIRSKPFQFASVCLMPCMPRTSNSKPIAIYNVSFATFPDRDSRESASFGCVN